MIKLKSIKFFEATNFGAESLDEILSKVQNVTKYNLIKLCANSFGAFTRVVEEIPGSGKELKPSRNMIIQFKGFLLVETDANQNYAEAILRAAKPWLKAVGFDDAAVLEVCSIYSAEECARVYCDGVRNVEAVNYYGGWTAVSSDGHVMQINLEAARKQYGEEYAEELSHKIFRYLRKYRKNTAIFKLRCIKFVNGYIFKLLPTSKALDLLLEGREVNAFFEHVKEVEEVRVRSLRHDMPAFKKKWTQIMLVVHEFFVTYRVIVSPAYDLPKVIFVNGPELAKESKKQFVAMITPIPLHISSDKVAAEVCRNITEDTLNIASVCEKVRGEYIELVERRRNAARTYLCLLATGFTHAEDERYARNCYNWERFNYTRLGQRNIYSLYKNNPGLARELGILVGTTLYPFLYLLVLQHPKITPSWLIEFEVVGEDGQEYGLREGGEFVVSEKSRNGFVNSQQVISLNQKSKDLFRDIQDLTKQAREYLKSIGDDSWRYLLLSGNGLSKPSRIKLLRNISDYRLKCPLRIALGNFFRDDKRIKLSRIGFRSFRVNVAVMRFLDSGDAYAMAEDLGHAGTGQDDLKEYLPLEIRQYFSNRRDRFFHNAFIFEAMQESAYLIDALDFETLEELDDFLKRHKLKPLPDSISLRAFIQEYYPDNAPPNSSRAVIPVSPALCTTLITLADVVNECKMHGEMIRDEALNWFHTANLMKTVVNLHDSGQIATCSNEVISIMKAAKHLPELATRLRPLVLA